MTADEVVKCTECVRLEYLKRQNQNRLSCLQTTLTKAYKCLLTRDCATLKSCRAHSNGRFGKDSQGSTATPGSSNGMNIHFGLSSLSVQKRRCSPESETDVMTQLLFSFLKLNLLIGTPVEFSAAPAVRLMDLRSTIANSSGLPLSYKYTWLIKELQIRLVERNTMSKSRSNTKCLTVIRMSSKGIRNTSAVV